MRSGRSERCPSELSDIIEEISMSKLTRRTVLATAAAAAASPMLAPAPVRAAAPISGNQAPGFYRYKLGDYEITVVNDGVWNRKLDASIVPGTSVAEVQQVLSEAFQPTETLTIPFNPVIINTGARLVAIDTSTGDRAFPTAGTYMANLAAAGIDAAKVDTIVISHFHPDHINGIWTKDDKLAFPNAEIMVPAPEWAFWMDEAKASNAPEGLKGNYANCKRVFASIADKVARYEPGKEVAPGIVSWAAYGHTPGHTGFTVSSGDKTLLMIIDSTGNPFVFARHPEWEYASDVDRKMAVDTRKRLLDRAAADKMLIQAMHFPFPANGHIVRDGSGYRFIPRAWSHLL
jgi:glyoxylase-like metal-dependent hydrolase (beta-lactamase superfamily II)